VRVSWSTTKTALLPKVVLAFVGPRPVVLANMRTMALEIASASSPSRSIVLSVIGHPRICAYGDRPYVEISRLVRGDDRNRTGVDGFAVRHKGVLSAYLRRFRGPQMLSGALKKRSVGESLGRVAGHGKLRWYATGCGCFVPTLLRSVYAEDKVCR
jgi:hypothetical protein